MGVFLSPSLSLSPSLCRSMCLFRFDWLVMSAFVCLSVCPSHLKCPFSSGVFSPSVSGHEWPFGKSISWVVIIGSGWQDHRSGAHWGSEEQLQISTSVNKKIKFPFWFRVLLVWKTFSGEFYLDYNFFLLHPIIFRTILNQNVIYLFIR